MPRHSLLRLLGVGLAVGLAGAAVLLVGLAVGELRTPCEFPGTEQCTFEASLHSNLARLQLLSALGCASLAGGIGLTVRRRG